MDDILWNDILEMYNNNDFIRYEISSSFFHGYILHDKFFPKHMYIYSHVRNNCIQHVSITQQIRVGVYGIRIEQKQIFEYGTLLAS